MTIDRVVINGSMIVSVVGAMMFSTTALGATGKVKWFNDAKGYSVSAVKKPAAKKPAFAAPGTVVPLSDLSIDPPQTTMPAASSTTFPVTELEDDEELIDLAW